MRLILHDANQFKFKQDLLWVGVSTLTTIIIWIIFSVYSAFTKPIDDPDINKLLSPLNPTLDNTVLTQIEERYVPPKTYTIMVKQENGDTTIIVPLDTLLANGVSNSTTSASADLP